MTPQRKYVSASVASGIAWGALVSVIARGSFPPPIILGGFAASPLIGYLIGAATRNWSKRTLWGRLGIALAALFGAATLFGIAGGVADGIDGGWTHRIPFEVVTQTVTALFWGLTFGGWAIFLFPLVWLNLVILGRVAKAGEGAPPAP